ncbi:MAG: hypothetical protein HY421_03045 [Candidatus Kerfeldbacteria bacterium]|nr:hypothetical protein [Candidatus Kerfeldbacteria bacterium]
MTRHRPSRRKRRAAVPPINRYGSIQAHHCLLQRAARLGLTFNGRPTGVFQNRDKLYLYEDVGVGCVRPRIVKRLKPLNAWDYLPRQPAGAA